MADGKSLKFQFVLDEQSFARVKRALGELTTEAAKFAKTMQGAGGGMFGGANVGRPPSAVATQGRGGLGQQGRVGTGIGQAILADVEAFQKLAKAGSSTMNMMKDAISRSLTEQGQHVRKLDRQIELLQNRFGSLKTDAQKANSAMAMMNLQNQRAGAVQTQGQLQQAYGNMQFGPMPAPPGSPPAPPAGPPIFGPGGNINIPGGALSFLTSVAKTAGIAAAGAMAVLNTSVSADQLGLTQEARRGQALKPVIDRMKRGDISDQMALFGLKNMKDSQERTELFRSVFGTDAKLLSKAQGFIGGFSLQGQDINQKLVDVFGTSTQGTEQIAKMQELIQSYKQTTDSQLGQQRYLDFTASTSGDRMASARVAGLGLYRDPKTGQLSDKRTKQYMDFLRQNEMLGLSSGDRMAGIIESRGQVGSGRYGLEAALTSASGYGGFNQLRGSAARMGNAALANMALGGGINAMAGIQLGMGVLGSGFDPRGTVSGAGMLGAFQGGYGQFLGKNSDPASQFNLVNQAIAGMGVGDALVGGKTSGFQMGMNLLGAINANPTGDVYAQDYLASGMSFKQLMAGAAGNLTETARLSGLTPGMMKEQLGNVADSALSLWVDTGAMDKRSRAMRRFRASGMSTNEFLTTSRDEDAKALAVQLGMMNPEFGEEGAIGYMRLMRGQGKKGVLGKTPMGGVDDEYKMGAERRVKELDEVADVLKQHFGAEGDITAGFKQWQNSVKAMGDLNASAEKLARTFGVLAGMSQAQIDKSLGSGTVEAVKTQVIKAPGVGAGDTAPSTVEGMRID